MPGCRESEYLSSRERPHVVGVHDMAVADSLTSEAGVYVLTSAQFLRVSISVGEGGDLAGMYRLAISLKPLGVVAVGLQPDRAAERAEPAEQRRPRVRPDRDAVDRQGAAHDAGDDDHHVPGRAFAASLPPRGVPRSWSG